MTSQIDLTEMPLQTTSFGVAHCLRSLESPKLG
jgi:hypothetical protein